MFVSDQQDVKGAPRRPERAPVHTGWVGPRTFLAGIALALALAGCGGGGSTATTTPGVSGNANPADVHVIDGWVTALRRGDVGAAAGYFAIPSVAENGPVLLHIKSVQDARHFNESLPCGARLIHAETAGQFTTATFRLTERPGPGICGPGTGGIAKTSFVIHDGKIAEWRRVGAGGGGQQAPSQST